MASANSISTKREEWERLCASEVRARVAFNPTDNLPRTEVRRVVCPACGAAAGALCIGRQYKPRVANHLERVKAAMRENSGQ